MYTDCPNCHTYFKITPMQLKAAKGKVRCGSCDHVFNALANLVEKVPPLSSRPASKVSQPAESVVREIDPISHMSSSVNSESIDLADTLLPMEDSDILGVESRESAVSPSQSRNALDDINRDIDDALDNLFDDDSLAIKPSPNVSSIEYGQTRLKSNRKRQVVKPKRVENKKKKEPMGEPEVSEFDLDGFDDLLFEASDSSDPPLEAMSENDSFTSSEPLQRHEVEWETLSRPAKPPSPPKPSKLEAIKNRLDGGFSVSRAMWIVIICLLIIVLLGQFAYAKHEQLVKSAPLKAVLEQACAVVGVFIDCEVPNPRDVEAFVIIDRNVAGHPNAENALLITSTISNEADFNQQFPELVLTFLDINQQILARRAFKPEEYAANGTDIFLGMQPKEPIKVMLEIVDPGEAAVNFKFDFR